MYVSTEMIRDLERKYGKPEEFSLSYEMNELEFGLVRRSQKHGRAHDVTLFIIKNGLFAVIRKPMYPAGAYRAPSGGVEPGERFEDGALREAYEETGLIVSLHRYILRVRVRFSHDGESIDWTTHVLTASQIGGELQPIDTHEIDEARFASVDELNGCIRNALLASGSTGLRYRSELNDIVMRKFDDEGLVAHP